MSLTLSLPEAEAAALRAAYEAADVILEYGSGGSTALAAAMPGKIVFSVESDPDWAARVRREVADGQKAARVVVHHADIGPVRKWGKPSSRAHAHLFRNYPLGIWGVDGFAPPDVVLIDGRFRAACFVTVAAMTEKPVTIFFDDYTQRPAYAEVERLARPVATIGRMARFELTPGGVRRADFPWMVGTFFEPDYARPPGPVRLLRRLTGQR